MWQGKNRKKKNYLEDPEWDGRLLAWEVDGSGSEQRKMAGFGVSIVELLECITSDSASRSSRFTPGK